MLFEKLQSHSGWARLYCSKNNPCSNFKKKVYFLYMVHVKCNAGDLGLLYLHREPSWQKHNLCFYDHFSREKITGLSCTCSSSFLLEVLYVTVIFHWPKRVTWLWSRKVGLPCGQKLSNGIHFINSTRDYQTFFY